MVSAPPFIEIVACLMLLATTISLAWFIYESHTKKNKDAEFDAREYSKDECRDALSFAYFAVGRFQGNATGWTLDEALALVEIALIHAKKGEIVYAEDTIEETDDDGV